MINDNFVNAPTVGSHEPTPTVDDLQAKMHNLLFQLTVAEAQRKADEEKARREAQQPRRKIRWGKVRKFFTAVIKPIIDFVPRLLNAIAKLKKAAADMMDAISRAKMADNKAV